MQSGQDQICVSSISQLDIPFPYFAGLSYGSAQIREKEANI